MKPARSTIALLLSLGCAMVLPMAAHADDDPASKTTAPESMRSDDKAFFEKASQAGLLEVQMGREARLRVHRADVRDYATTTVRDQAAADAGLTQLAKQKSVILGSVLDEEHAHVLKKLLQSDPDQFDKEYIKTSVVAHRQAVSLFTDTSQDSRDAQIRNFAAAILPTLRKHLDRAQALDQAQIPPR